MSATIDVELILRTIDEACRDRKQKFKTTTNELMEALRKLYHNSALALTQLSISDDDNQQTKQNQLNAERIVSKLKELKESLDDTWPSNMDCFTRDMFNVGSYRVEAAEFFHPVQFYPGNNFIMKL
jgi:hypothetical protein